MWALTFGFTVPEISLLLIKFLEAQLKVELVLVLFRYAYARVFHMEPDDVVRNLVDLHSNLAFDSVLRPPHFGLVYVRAPSQGKKKKLIKCILKSV